MATRVAPGDRMPLKREWVTIPETKGFWMGARKGDPKARNYDPEAFDGDEPVRRVDVPSFRLGKYLVTVEEYGEFLEAGGGFGKTAEPAGWADQVAFPNRPVVGVSYFEAVAYAEWAGGRLPDEEEWERAARGPASTKYPWGNDPITPEHANFDQRGIGHASPVGSYPMGASAEGVLDLIGNVWEWTASYYDQNRRSLVIRGGSWNYSSRFARSAYRDHFRPEDRVADLGFRLAQGVT